MASIDLSQFSSPLCNRILNRSKLGCAAKRVAFRRAMGGKRLQTRLAASYKRLGYVVEHGDLLSKASIRGCTWAMASAITARVSRASAKDGSILANASAGVARTS